RILAGAKVQDEQQQLLQYPGDKCLFISKAMQRFKLCYPVDRSETLLIPALLADELPRYPAELNNDDTLHFEFAFNGFLPRNLIGEFIVSRHQEIKGDQQSQRGAVFKSRTLRAEALVEADYHRRLLVMQVYGRDAKDYLTVLYDAMHGIFGDLALDYREWVALPRSARLDEGAVRSMNESADKAPYSQLLAHARKGQRIFIAESGLSYDIGKVLGFILSKKAQDQAGIIIQGDYVGEKKVSNINQNVTNSTVHGSVVAAETIENSFIGLQQSQANDEVKLLLEQLLAEIKDLNGKVPASQSIDDMSRDAEALVLETQREAPRQNRLSMSLDGIKEAAQTIGAIAKPVWEVAEKLSPLLSVLGV
ncbi:MAG: hypothetical protein ACU84J_12540, partial [Gammaproteobacteria bacterium]